MQERLRRRLKWYGQTTRREEECVDKSDDNGCAVEEREMKNEAGVGIRHELAKGPSGKEAPGCFDTLKSGKRCG